MKFSELSKEEKIKFWNETEKEINNLFQKYDNKIPQGDKDSILEYLAHNELGLALDHLSYSLIEYEIKIDENILDEMIRLYQKMGCDEDEIERVKNSIQINDR